MTSLTDYLRQIDIYWSNRNGKLLADWMSLRHYHAKNKNLASENPEMTVNNYVYDPFNELVSSHLKCIYWLTKGDVERAHNEQNLLFQGFIRLLQYYKEENWLLPLMHTLCLDLRLLANKVDQQGIGSGEEGDVIPRGNNSSVVKPREALEKAAEAMMTCFRICSSDNRSSEQDTKKWGMLSLVNQLFKLYFRINKLHLMKPLIRAIDSSPFKDKYPLSQQITYRYYVGRKAMFDSDYKLANESLTFAFQKCHKQSKRNKHLILIYLIPLKILLGFLPKKELLEKYDLLQLWEVGEAVRSGNARKLSKAIETHQNFFIKSGIYLILERLRLVTYRNLFKKVYLIANNPVLTLEDLLIALRFSEGGDIELEEANCILANLIHQGKIKGYISHTHQKVVLSKMDAFPRLSTLGQ
ncbi:PCI domain-containing protein 2 [Cimex lectularius]|uniref:PCI domain-containing protein 2 homolog n=1 Tax=Cimex lectularius TaxID=79782 RepID=A0A8I6RU41_CIMLE|nr:PCI domain-containing protein 2 [Cimex lectularius]